MKLVQHVMLECDEWVECEWCNIKIFQNNSSDFLSGVFLNLIFLKLLL